jgi:hypothetical protein
MARPGRPAQESLENRGLGKPPMPVWPAFGADLDYGEIVRSFEAEPIGAGRYSPPRVVAEERSVIQGSPAPRRICTSYVER